MKSYNIKQFNTAQELWEAIRPESIHETLGLDTQTKLIYRGQADSTWLLLPNAARGKKDVTVDQQVKDEVQLILYFLEYCDNTGIQVPGNIYNLRKNLEEILSGANGKELLHWPSQKNHEVLAFAQHYGVPTRLLDWSNRSFVSAYFGASEVVKLIASEIQKGQKVNLDRQFAIWVLDKNSVDRLNKSIYLNNSSEPINPFQIISVPSSTNAHIAAQQGCFSIFRNVIDDGQSDSTLDYFLPPKFSCTKTIDNSSSEYVIHLHKLTLSYGQAHNLLNLCELYNTNAASLFPTATGAGYAVRDRANYEIVKAYVENHKIGIKY